MSMHTTRQDFKTTGEKYATKSVEVEKKARKTLPYFFLKIPKNPVGDITKKVEARTGERLVDKKLMSEMPVQQQQLRKAHLPD